MKGQCKSESPEHAEIPVIRFYVGFLVTGLVSVLLMGDTWTDRSLIYVYKNRSEEAETVGQAHL